MITNISQLDAERIIYTLGDGVPHVEHILDYSSEGDTVLLNTVKDQLGKVKKGLTIARFIKGDYGSGKSHFLSMVREIALRENFVVSYFDLRAREGFDMIERILSKLIKTLSVFNKRQGDADITVLDFIFKQWGQKALSIEEEIAAMPLDATNRDFLNIIKLYGKIMSGHVQRHSGGIDLLELINRWFQAEGLTARQRREINVNNNITVRHARNIMDSLAIFFREIGYSGWIILIDEQEIIPTLMSKRKRDLSNENLKVVIDTQHRTKYFYYLFATTPEFFTDPINGINAYPALRQRVQDVLEIHPITEKDMIEAGKKIKEIYCIAYPDFQRGCLSEKGIRGLANLLNETFANISAKARIYIVSYIKLLRQLQLNPSLDVNEEFKSITGQVWDELEKKAKEAFKVLID